MSDIKIKFVKPVQLSSEMKESLAQCYNMPGFRKYLENKIISYVTVGFHEKDEIKRAEYRGVVKFLEHLLGTSKNFYYDYNTLKTEREKRKAKK
jgi:hypothetical protein